MNQDHQDQQEQWITKPIDQNGVLVNEIWLTDPVTNYQISNLGRYKTPKKNTDIPRQCKKAISTKTNNYQVEYIVARLYMGYDPLLHFLELIYKDVEYPYSINNIRLIPRSLDKYQNGVLVKEQWLPIPEFDRYYCSNIGRIYSDVNNNPRLLKPDVSVLGYHRYTLKHKSGKFVRWFAHRLIHMTHRPDIDISNLIVNHIDSDRSNNRLDNLEAITQQQNMMHAVMLGRNNLPGRGRKDRLLRFEDVEWKDKEIKFSLPPSKGKSVINVEGFKF